MIICRLRSRAGIYLSVILLLLGASLAARANTPVLQSQMRSFVYETFGAGVVILFGSVWVLLQSYVSGMRKDVKRIEDSVERLIKAIELHNESPLAHTAASEHNHAPMNTNLEALAKGQSDIKERLNKLIAEHELIRETEVCLMRQSAAAKRDPRQSPKPRREDDPDEFDGRPLRGKQ